jgi:hypothetical protein
MKLRNALLLASLLPAVALANPYSEPYVLFRAAPHSATRDVQPATILRVDGERARGARSDPLPPGLHHVEVSLPPARPVASPKRAVLVVDASACTLYFLGARRIAGSSEWEAFIDRVEPIGECRA